MGLAAVWRCRLELYKIAGIPLADRTDKIRRKRVRFQDIAADTAAVAGNLGGWLLIGGGIWRGDAVLFQVIIGVGQYRCIRI